MKLQQLHVMEKSKQQRTLRRGAGAGGGGAGERQEETLESVGSEEEGHILL